MNCELMLTYDTPALRQTGSRNLTSQKNASHDMGYLYEACDQISDFCHQYLLKKNETKNVHICSMCIKTNKVGKQEIGI
jgi:hypothetical protein